MLLESVLIFFNLLAVLSYLKFLNSQDRYEGWDMSFLVSEEGAVVWQPEKARHLSVPEKSSFCCNLNSLDKC